MVKYASARHVGEGDSYYQRGRVYPIAIKIGFFSKKIQVYKRRGYYDEMEPGTHRVYRDMDAFDKIWIDVKEDQ